MKYGPLLCTALFGGTAAFHTSPRNGGKRSSFPLVPNGAPSAIPQFTLHSSALPDTLQQEMLLPRQVIAVAGASASAALGAAATGGNIASAAALVAGNMVGAGVLALPAVTAVPGFLPSSAALVAVWGYCLLTAFLLAEVGAGTGAGADGSWGIQTMAAQTLGPKWGAAVCGMFVASNYLLLVAYISQGSNIVASVLGSEACGPFLSRCVSQPALTPLLFGVVLGSARLFAPPAAANAANNALVVAIAASFAGLLAVGLPGVEVGVLTATFDVAAAPAMLPVALTATVFQNIVPVVLKQLKGDLQAVRAALTWGSGIPIGMYLLWDAVILGQRTAPAISIDGGGAVGSAASGAVEAAAGTAAVMAPAYGVASLEALGQVPALPLLVSVFSFAALVTSFWGATASLSEEFAAVLGGKAATPATGSAKPADASAAAAATARGFGKELVNRAVALAMVVLPPSCACMLWPDVFLGALDASGTYGDPILYGIVPAAMAWRLKGGGQSNGPDTSSSDDGGGGADSSAAVLVPGGRVTLAAVMAAAVLFIAGESDLVRGAAVAMFDHLT